MNTNCLHAAVAAILIIAPMSRISHAQNASTQATFAKAFDAYVAFDCATALPLFRHGLQQSNDARAWYYVGNCERWRGEREASDSAYANGLKQAPEGSDIKAKLKSARESLPVAFSPQLQTALFYETAKKAGFDVPPGIVINMDPRLAPVHLENAFYIKNDRKPGPDPESKWRSNEIRGFNASYDIVDYPYDKKIHEKNLRKVDAIGWEYVTRIRTYFSRIIGYPDSGWIASVTEFQTLFWDDSPRHVITETRCNLSAIRADFRRPDAPTLRKKCVAKSGDIYVDNSGDDDDYQIPFYPVSGW